MDSAKRKGPAREVEIGAADLPLHCPTPAMQLWNSHPRVYLPFGDQREALCPYCGTLYRLAGDVTAAGH